MTLHVFSDSFGLYPKYVVENVEKYGNIYQSLFFNLVDNSTVTSEKIIFLSASIQKQRKAAQEISETIQCIVFHPYQSSSWHFLQMIKNKYPAARVCWVFWSFELYNLPSVYINLLDTFSKKFYLDQEANRKRSLKQRLLKYMPSSILDSTYQLFDRALVTEKKYIKSFHLIDEFYALLENDYLYLVNHFNAKHIRHHPFAYLSLEKMIPNVEQIPQPGDEIMIGHSASIESNHYEIITKIASYQLPNTIFIPLSYGNDLYRDAIMKYAKSKFSSVDILTAKIEPQDYYERLKKIGYCVINIKVQQGLGNITALLMYGVKLFLSKHASTFKDFKNAGIVLYSIEDELNKEALETKLSPKDIENNRSILIGMLSDQKLSEYWKKFNKT